QAFGVTALGLAAGLLAWWGGRQFLHTAGWHPLARLIVEGGICLAAFYAAAGVLQRKLLRERLALVWSLLWGRSARGR
ncbi:MAG: hypothetical protein ACP5TV_12170, partial [Anaerolineae bacterium]